MSEGSYRWWLLSAGAPVGPYSEQQIRDDIRAGKIGINIPACPEGGRAYKPLHEWLSFHPTATLGPPATNALPPAIRGGWNPKAVAFWGLLFSPVWTGIMAAINS